MRAPDPALPVGVGVEQRALHVRDRRADDALLVRHLHREGLVGVAGGQGQQVGGAVEEVAVEAADAQALAAADAHHSLPRGGPCQVVDDLRAELDLVALGAVAGVVVQLQGGWAIENL